MNLLMSLSVDNELIIVTTILGLDLYLISRILLVASSLTVIHLSSVLSNLAVVMLLSQLSENSCCQCLKSALLFG